MSYKEAFEKVEKIVKEYSEWNKEEMKDPNSSEFENGMDFAYDEVLDIILKCRIGLV